MGEVPYTRDLAYVLRDKLKEKPLKLTAATVVSVPDARHVTVTLDGSVNFTVPRLKSYTAPAAGDPAFLLITNDLILAIGSVK
jgi:hypothetical protein